MPYRPSPTGDLTAASLPGRLDVLPVHHTGERSGFEIFFSSTLRPDDGHVSIHDPLSFEPRSGYVGSLEILLRAFKAVFNDVRSREFQSARTLREICPYSHVLSARLSKLRFQSLSYRDSFSADTHGERCPNVGECVTFVSREYAKREFGI